MILEAARALRVAADAIESRGAARRLRGAPTDPAAAVDYIAGFRYGHITPTPSQIRSEIVRLLELLAERRPKSVLELGTYLGGTLFLFATVAAPDATLVTVDLEEGPFGGGYPRAWRPFLRAFARNNQKICLVLGDTKNPSTLATVTDALRVPVDFLFVDADHSYEGISSDYQTYSPLVAPGGLIALHDIVPGTADWVGGVPQFWQELKQTVRHEELVESWEQGGYGIGVIQV